MNNTNPSI